MGIKYSLEEARQEFIDRNLIPLFNKYNINNEKLLAQTQEGYLVMTGLINLKYNHIPDKFSTYNPHTIHNIKLWCKLNNKSFELLSDIYNGNNKNLQWKCLKDDCGEIFEANWAHIYRNQGCPYCAGSKVCLSNCLATKNPELAKEWHPTKNGDLTPYDVTVSSNQYAWWLCLNNKDHEWRSKIHTRNQNKGCPECNESKGEKRIKEILENKNILKVIQNEFNKLNYNFNNINIFYIPQKEFDNLIGLGGGLLSYDFYLPQYNLLIEYQGQMHEKFVRGVHKSKKDFEKQVEHDRRKYEYAQNNNINLLEIWYYDYDNIEEILENFLSR